MLQLTSLCTPPPLRLLHPCACMHMQVTTVCRFILGEEVLASYSIPFARAEVSFVAPVRNLFLIALGYLMLAGLVLKVSVDRAVKGAPLLPRDATLRSPPMTTQTSPKQQQQQRQRQ
jgi:hypothetical protein